MPQQAPSRNNSVQFTAPANYQKEPAQNSENKEAIESKAVNLNKVIDHSGGAKYFNAM